MTLMPRRPRARWPDGPRGSRFHPPFPMAHQHRRSQEGTLNRGKIRVFAALVALVALAGAIGYGTRTVQAAALTLGGTKACAATGPTTANCTLSLTFANPSPPPAGTSPSSTSLLTITVTSPTGATLSSLAVVSLTPISCATTTVSGNVITIATGATSCTGITLTETIGGLTAGTSNTISQSVTLAGNDTGSTTVSATVTTPAAPPTTPTATKSCTALTTTSASCTLAVTFPTAPAASATTNALISLTAPAGGTLTLTGATLTPSTCGTATVAGNTVIISTFATPSCTGLTVTEIVTGLAAGVTNTVSQTVAFTGGLNASVTATTTVSTTPAAAQISITCTSTPGAPALTTFNTFLPATPTTPLAAVGVVPATVSCSVNLGTLDPGVVEISSVNGLLVSSSGTLTTNLRIPCGTTGVAGSCTGAIAFAVASGGVGFVTVQARYEPAPTSTSTERETSATIAFVAPPVIMSLSLNPNPVAVGAKGNATATFFVAVSCAGGAAPSVPTTTILIPAGACVDVTTGAVITAVPSSSVLNGTVLFSIDNTAIASWTGAPVSGSPITTPPAAAPSATGFTTSANQVSVRCGFFPTTPLPSVFGATATSPFLPFPGSLAQFFGGCTSVRAEYIGVAPGAATVSAQFIPDLPGALGSVPFTGVAANVNPLFSLVGATNVTSTRVLEVTAATPSGKVDLARGCNNVSPTVTEAAADYAKRVSPSGALVAIWEHQAATNTFRGFSPQAGAPSDLAQVTRLRPVFICVSGPATLDQPAA